MQLSCIAVDDEPLALEQLTDFIARVPYLDLKATFRKGFEAMMYMDENQVDLVFLDIQMNDITGIQILKTVKNKPLVILTTAYDKYAIEGYELDVTDYLLKPISYERFVKAAEKAYTLKSLANQGMISKVDASSTPNYIFIKADYSLQKINFDDILYIEGYKDYLRFFLTGNRKIMSLMNFKTIEDKLPQQNFFRVHKSFIVAVSKIDLIRKQKIKIGERLIPIGDTYRQKFYQLLEIYYPGIESDEESME